MVAVQQQPGATVTVAGTVTGQLTPTQTQETAKITTVSGDQATGTIHSTF